MNPKSKYRTMIAGASLLAIFTVVYVVMRGPRTAPQVQPVSESTAAQAAPHTPGSEGLRPTSPSRVAPAAQADSRSALLAMINDQDPEFSRITNNELDTFLLLTRHLPVDETTARALSRDLARARAAQLLYQGAIAKIVPESSDRTRVEIPAYPEEGKALMDFVNQSLVSTLPSVTGIAEFWENSLDAEFNFFGRCTQEIVFTRDATARRNNAVAITSTISTGEPGILAIDESFLRLSSLGSFAVYSTAIPE